MALCRQFLLMLSADPVFQKLCWRDVAERGMATSPVVERLDVVEQIGDRFVPRVVAGAMHALILQAVEEALREKAESGLAYCIVYATYQGPTRSLYYRLLLRRITPHWHEEI